MQNLSSIAKERLDESISTDPLWCGRRREVMAAAESAGLRWVVPGDPEWPAGVADLDHAEPIAGTGGAPLGLWLRGEGRLDELLGASVAIVGARACTTYGAEVAGDIAADCADVGVTVVSGAAFGIDAQAHRGALSVQGPTVAVLACGADLDYPRAHTALLHRVAETGVIVSEYPPRSPAQRHRFLARNRLIAAMTHGTVVVEAAVRSGSLNTMHWADQLGRTSMAVPGPVTSQASGGTHRAIRDGKAVMVRDGSDVVEEILGVPLVELADGPAPVARRILDVVGRSGRDLSEIAAATQVSARTAKRALADLVGQGRLRVHPALDGVETWSTPL